jgi:hypothetical protein
VPAFRIPGRTRARRLCPSDSLDPLVRVHTGGGSSQPGLTVPLRLNTAYVTYGTNRERATIN